MKNQTPQCLCRRRGCAEMTVGRGQSPPRKSLCPAHRRRHIGTTTTKRPPPHISHPGRSSSAADTHIVHVVARAHTQTVSRARRLVVSSPLRLVVIVVVRRIGHTVFLPPLRLKLYTPSRLVFAACVLCAGMVLGGESVVGELGAAATKLDPSCNIGLFSALRPAMDLSTAAYRYNQNMMEYYTCEYRASVINRV